MRWLRSPLRDSGFDVKVFATPGFAAVTRNMGWNFVASQTVAALMFADLMLHVTTANSICCIRSNANHRPAVLKSALHFPPPRQGRIPPVSVSPAEPFPKTQANDDWAKYSRAGQYRLRQNPGEEHVDELLLRLLSPSRDSLDPPIEKSKQTLARRTSGDNN